MDPAPPQAGDARFNRDESAALFVGVRKFTHRELSSVPYAADDAVDLAYLFVFDRRVQLVRADRVILALSGRPEKEESKRRLEMLQRAGASVQHADQTDIVSLLRRQAALAGKNGILVVSLATHGFVRDGLPYILGASSAVQYPATTVSVSNLLDTAARSRALRSLVFIDACRERLSAATRSVTQQTQAAPRICGMGRAHGQAVFFAAAAGQVAYDDDVSRNGVFTKAVMEGLRCNAAKPRGNVTASSLGTYVDNSVRKWIRQHRDSVVDPAIQMNIDGDARNMPLAQCWPTGCPDPAICRVARVKTKGTSVIALKSDGAEAWRRDAGERIEKAFVDDTYVDGGHEVVVATKSGVRAYDGEGKEIWAVREGRPLRAIAVGDLFRDHRRETVAVWGDEASRLSIYSAEGERVSYFDSPERIDHVAIGRPTKHHAPKIVVTAGTTVRVFDPKKIARGKPLWSGVITPRDQTVERIETTDCDKDGKDDICVTTENGTLMLDFKGQVLGRHARHDGLQFHLLHSHRKRP